MVVSGSPVLSRGAVCAMTINPEQINVNVLLESTIKQTFGFVQLPLYRNHEPDIWNAENFLWFSGFLTYLAESVQITYWASSYSRTQVRPQDAALFRVRFGDQHNCELHYQWSAEGDTRRYVCVEADAPNAVHRTRSSVEQR